MRDKNLTSQLVDWTRDHFFGKYRGMVVDNIDPTSRGRIQVTVPAVMGEGNAVWAMPCVPYAGDGVGFRSLPAVDTGVWVEFEAGDPSFPIWTGCFWGEGQMPEADTPDTTHIWKTESATILIDDSAEEIKIHTRDDYVITITTDEIEIKASSGRQTLSASEVETRVSGTKKIVIASSGVDVNNSALVVS